MITKTTILNLKNGKIVIGTETPYVVDLKIGGNLQKCHVVYLGTYYPFVNGEYHEDSGACGWIKHETILGRESFDRVEDFNALYVNSEVYNSRTGSNMTFEDDEEK